MIGVATRCLTRRWSILTTIQEVYTTRENQWIDITVPHVAKRSESGERQLAKLLYSNDASLFWHSAQQRSHFLGK